MGLVVGTMVMLTAAEGHGASACVLTATPAADLQSLFTNAITGATSGPGWLGADCDTTFAWSGNATHGTTAMLFGDTFVGTYDPATHSRAPGAVMPHSTMGFLSNAGGAGPTPGACAWSGHVCLWLAVALAGAASAGARDARELWVGVRARAGATPSPWTTGSERCGCWLGLLCLWREVTTA